MAIRLPGLLALTAGLLMALALFTPFHQPVAYGADTAIPATTPAPAWTKDLIIYEIAPKGFTSPNGPESGTFNSLKAKLPYLQELGITGIWLAGHSQAPAHTFFNVWSQYANVEPDKIEPSLGTPEEFHSLICEAHRHGIRIFLDVHVRGVHPNSPLITKHPAWFKGDAGGMCDFDWQGQHKDLDAWWVDVWTDCVKQYEVDGFRLDINIARPDLWAKIRQNAAATGHEIVIFEENDFPVAGVSDFDQHAYTPNALAPDVAGFYRHKFGKAGDYYVRIQYANGKTDSGSTDGNGLLHVQLDGLSVDKVGRRIVDSRRDGIPDVRLTVDKVGTSPISNIIVDDNWPGQWQLTAGVGLVVEGKPPCIQVYLPTLSHGWPSNMLSCHDSGWEGFAEKNPYTAQGSRALFGYALLMTPMIPLFFSGEEFEASFHPIPWLSPKYLDGAGDAQSQLKSLYAAGSPSHVREQDIGKGRWLYGNMLDWSELDQPQHRAMFEDVKKMIAVRKQDRDLLAAVPDREEPKLTAVPCRSNITVPPPYVRWNGQRAILVAANRDVHRDAQLNVQVPLREIGLAGHATYHVIDLWPGSPTKKYSGEQLAALTFVVPRDKTAGGGLRVFTIEPADVGK
jgi:hypothetical protein